MRLRTTIGLLAAVALACGRSEEPAPAPAAPPPAAAPAPAPAAPPAPAAAAAPDRPPDAARGAEIYAANCATCHGPRGDGDGPAAAALNPRPAKHSDGAIMNALSDDFLFRVIKDGGPSVGKSAMMAPWGGTLSDAQIRDVVAFVRTLAKPPYTPK
jgi:mono/diheme cytochrome c family protein